MTDFCQPRTARDGEFRAPWGNGDGPAAPLRLHAHQPHTLRGLSYQWFHPHSHRPSGHAGNRACIGDAGLHLPCPAVNSPSNRASTCTRHDDGMQQPTRAAAVAGGSLGTLHFTYPPAPASTHGNRITASGENIRHRRRRAHEAQPPRAHRVPKRIAASSQRPNFAQYINRIQGCTRRSERCAYPPFLLRHTALISVPPEMPSRASCRLLTGPRRFRLGPFLRVTLRLRTAPHQQQEPSQSSPHLAQAAPSRPQDVHHSRTCCIPQSRLGQTGDAATARVVIAT